MQDRINSSEVISENALSVVDGTIDSEIVFAGLGDLISDLLHYLPNVINELGDKMTGNEQEKTYPDTMRITNMLAHFNQKYSDYDVIRFRFTPGENSRLQNITDYIPTGIKQALSDTQLFKTLGDLEVLIFRSASAVRTGYQFPKILVKNFGIAGGLMGGDTNPNILRVLDNTITAKSDSEIWRKTRKSVVDMLYGKGVNLFSEVSDRVASVYFDKFNQVGKFNGRDLEMLTFTIAMSVLNENYTPNKEHLKIFNTATETLTSELMGSLLEPKELQAEGAAGKQSLKKITDLYNSIYQGITEDIHPNSIIKKIQGHYAELVYDETFLKDIVGEDYADLKWVFLDEDTEVLTSIRNIQDDQIVDKNVYQFSRIELYESLVQSQVMGMIEASAGTTHGLLTFVLQDLFTNERYNSIRSLCNNDTFSDEDETTVDEFLREIIIKQAHQWATVAYTPRFLTGDLIDNKKGKILEKLKPQSIALMDIFHAARSPEGLGDEGFPWQSMTQRGCGGMNELIASIISVGKVALRSNFTYIVNTPGVGTTGAHTHAKGLEIHAIPPEL